VINSTRLRMSLSGEMPSEEVLGAYDGVGLLRSEFVLRRINAYITERDAAEAVARYVASVADLAAPRPVWYRSSDLWSDEANVLRGVDERLREDNPIIGYRGARRRAVAPCALLTEIEVVQAVARDRPNLHWLVPFVALPAEFEAVAALLEASGWPNQLGCMLEIPAALLQPEGFVAAGATNLLVGLNDLTSLLLGAVRGNALHDKLNPALWHLVDSLHRLPGSCEWGIGGTLCREILDAARDHGVPYATVHYSELPEVVGTDPSLLPELGLVREIKRATRSRIERARAWDFRRLNSPASSL
jgi:phosphoenolpyruvate-protein kinase (PTS system EI component)